MAIHWQCFGSNGEEKADYSRGVLERFTRRAPSDWSLPWNKPENRGLLSNLFVKTICNPRKIRSIPSPHSINYFFLAGYSVDETSRKSMGATPTPISVDKIAINHYSLKSLEEYLVKRERGDAVNYRGAGGRSKERFLISDRNDEFDDGILKYRDERAKIYQPPDKSHTNERLFNALIKNISPIFLSETPLDFYENKMETFLTCCAVSSYFKTKLIDNAVTKFFEEASLKAILNSLDQMTVVDVQLLISELPNLFNLPYPIVKKIHNKIVQCMPQIIENLRLTNGCSWSDYTDLDYIQDLLKFVIPVPFKED